MGQGYYYFESWTDKQKLHSLMELYSYKESMLFKRIEDTDQAFLRVLKDFDIDYQEFKILFRSEKQLGVNTQETIQQLEGEDRIMLLFLFLMILISVDKITDYEYDYTIGFYAHILSVSRKEVEDAVQLVFSFEENIRREFLSKRVKKIDSQTSSGINWGWVIVIVIAIVALIQAYS